MLCFRRTTSTQDLSGRSHGVRHAVGYHVNIVLFFHLHSGYLPGLGLASLARRPEADLDGVGICAVAAVVPHPVFPSTGPPDHSPKLPGFSMGSPVSGFCGLVWPSFMDELWLVVMVCPASIGPTEAHLSLVIMGDAEEVVVNNAKVPWHDGWAKRGTYELVGCKLVNSTCVAIRRLCLPCKGLCGK